MAEGFTEDQLALIRDREKYARDLAAQELARAARSRPVQRQGEPEAIANLDVAGGLADPSLRTYFERGRVQRAGARSSDSAQAKRERIAALRQRIERDVSHIAREDVWRPKETHALGKAREWLESGTKKHLMLCGLPGRGKSVAAAWLAKRYLAAGPGRRVCWVHPDDLVTMVLHSYDDRAPKIAPLVIVDDLGRETKSKHDVGEALTQLLDKPGVKVVITTNMRRVRAPGQDEETFSERYDERLRRRLNATTVAIDVTGDDMRPCEGGF